MSEPMYQVRRWQPELGNVLWLVKHRASGNTSWTVINVLTGWSDPAYQRWFSAAEAVALAAAYQDQAYLYDRVWGGHIFSWRVEVVGG